MGGEGKEAGLDGGPVKGRPNPSPKLKKDGSTPLHISAYYKARDLGIAKLLLQYKADANAQ